jgi:hypothetical protein
MTLNEKVLSLVNEIGDIRNDFIEVVSGKHGGDAIRVLVGVACVADNLVNYICTRHKMNKPPESQGQRVAALKNEGVIPAKIANSLQMIEILANHARLRSQGVPLTADDANSVVSTLLSVMEWYYCESPAGPGFKSIYVHEFFAEARETILQNPQFMNFKFWLKLPAEVKNPVFEAIQESETC